MNLPIQKKKSRVTRRKRLKERSGKIEKLENQVSIWETNIFFIKLQNFPRTQQIFNKARILSYFENYSTKVGKVHIFWEGHQLFDWQYIGQIFGGDFAKFCGLLRIYELYNIHRYSFLQNTTWTLYWMTRLSCQD